MTRDTLSLGKGVNLVRDAQGKGILRLRGDWSSDVENALATQQWERIVLGGVSWPTYEQLLPFREKIEWLDVTVGPDSSHGLDDLTAVKRLRLNDLPKPPIDYRRFPKLQALDVHCGTKRTLPYLANPGLEELTIHGFEGTDLEVFKDLKRLQLLELRQGRLRSLAGIEQLTALRELYLVDLRQLVDISAVEYLTSLAIVDGEGLTKLADVEPVRRLPALTTLRLVAPKGRFVDLKWIESMPKLQELLIRVPTDHLNWGSLAQHGSLIKLSVTASSGYKVGDDEIVDEFTSRGSQIVSFTRFDCDPPEFTLELARSRP